jgi:hypothetical protein
MQYQYCYTVNGKGLQAMLKKQTEPAPGLATLTRQGTIPRFHGRFVMGEVVLEPILLELLRVSMANYHSIVAPYTSITAS